MEAHQVVPDVIPAAPPAVVEVRYGDLEVSGGNVLTPTQVISPPTSVVWPVVTGALYTLIMTDPDAPSRKDPKNGEFLHWLEINIPGTDLAAGDVMVDYVGSGPPKDTGLHRYVFLIYQQPGKLTLDHPRATNTEAGPRPKFKAAKFARDNRLELVAGNLYQAEYDETTILVHRQLGFGKR